MHHARRGVSLRAVVERSFFHQPLDGIDFFGQRDRASSAIVCAPFRGVLAPARPALPSIDAGVVNDEHGDAPAPQLEQPILHRQPGSARALAACGHRGRKVIQNEEVDAIDMLRKGLLAFDAGEIDPASDRKSRSPNRQETLELQRAT
jgi:hypothetical protein